MVKGLFRPHYMTWSEQAQIEKHAPAYLQERDPNHHRNGPPNLQGTCLHEEGTSGHRQQSGFIADSKTPTGVAEVPLTDFAVEAFQDQIGARRARTLAVSELASSPPSTRSISRRLGNGRFDGRAYRHFRLYDLQIDVRDAAQCRGRRGRVGHPDAPADRRKGFQEVLTDEAADEA